MAREDENSRRSLRIRDELEVSATAATHLRCPSALLNQTDFHEINSSYLVARQTGQSERLHCFLRQASSYLQVMIDLITGQCRARVCAENPIDRPTIITELR